MLDLYQDAHILDNGGVETVVTDHGPEGGEPVLMVHGFPDSALLWRHQIPVLAAAGYRVLAPDIRGFGRSGKPEGSEHYRMSVYASDVHNVLDSLGIDKVNLVGHDWGSGICWYLAITAPERVKSLSAVSVGHPLAFKDAGMRQMARSWYMLLFQFDGVAEEWLQRDNWSAFRQWSGDATDFGSWVADLERPGALSAALGVYRANMSPAIMTAPAPTLPKVQAPVMGVWSSGDTALVETQMTGSARYVDAEFRYERLEDVSHWIPVDAPDRLNELLIDWLPEPSG